jgi:hypothetical protein
MIQKEIIRSKIKGECIESIFQFLIKRYKVTIIDIIIIIMQPKDVEVVCYHYPCMDGIASAYVSQKFNPSIKLVKWIHGCNLESILPDFEQKNVLFIDVCPFLNQLEKIKTVAKSVYVLDHHFSKQEECGHLEYCKFDMSISGCVMAWNYFFPDKEVPLVLKCIMDRDLMQYGKSYPESEAFTASWYQTVLTEPSSFPEFDFTIANEESFDNYVIGGKMMMKADPIICADLDRIAMFRKVKIEGFDRELVVKMANSTYHFCNQGGIHFAENPKADFGMTWYYDGSVGFYRCSLRSIDGKVDVSKIAKTMFAGGHKMAAGFQMTTPPFEWGNALN